MIEGIAWIRGYTTVNSGHFTEGTKKTVKPQSVINAENRQAAVEQARLAQAQAQQRKAQLKAEAKVSLKRIGNMLARGDYKVNNYRRSVTYHSSWSIYDLDYDNCRIEMKERTRQIGLKSGDKIGKDRTQYHTISMRYAALRGSSDSEYDPQHCLWYSNEYGLCYSSYSDPGTLVDMINAHANKYCR
jgi:hypothetical protein